MKRTIEVKRDAESRQPYAYYGGKQRGYIAITIQKRFGIQAEGRYRITVTEGREFEPINADCSCCFCIQDEHGIYGKICRTEFAKLFFKPDGRKRYDITVKKVKYVR